MAHDIDRDMRQIEVFQFHRTDVVGVRNLDFVLVFFGYSFSGVGVGVRGRSGTGFGAVSGLGFYSLRENILLLKQHLNYAPDLINRPLATVQGRNSRKQHIRVVFDIIEIIVIFIVVVGAFVVVKVVLQLSFQSTILCFCRHHIAVLYGVGGCTKGRHTALYQNGAGGNDIEHEYHQQADTGYDQRTLFVLGDELGGFLGFLGSFLCSLGGRFRRLNGIACGLTGFRCHVFLFDGAFLLPSGIRVA